MSSAITMEELLAQCSEPLTEAEYRSRREQLLLAFSEQHSLHTWSDIEKAIRTHDVGDSWLVDEFIELRAYEPAMARLSRKRPQKRREDADSKHTGRESGPFLLRLLKMHLLRVYNRLQ